MKSHIMAAWKTVGAFLLAVLLTAPVAGQAPPKVSSMSGQVIELLVGHGRVLHLDAGRIGLYGPPTIADLRIVAPDVVYVYGRKIGTTNLIAISADQRTRANVAFRVVADRSSANISLRELQPTTYITRRRRGRDSN